MPLPGKKPGPVNAYLFTGSNVTLLDTGALKAFPVLVQSLDSLGMTCADIEQIQGIAISAAMSAVGLFAIGAVITLMTGRHPVKNGLRQVLFGLATAAVTFGIGKLIGVSIN